MLRNNLTDLPWFSPAPVPADFYPGTAHWSDLDGPDGGDIFKVAWSSTESGVVWAGSLYGDIFRYSSETEKWIRRTPRMDRRTWVTGIEFIPEPASRLLASFASGRIMGSDDNGISWNDRSSGLPGTTVHIICPHPVHPALMLAGTDTGLYLSADGAGSWIPFPAGALSGEVTAVCCHPFNSLVFWLAVADRTGPKILKTSDGGRQFEILFESAGKFLRIHTILTDSSGESLWISGYGGFWGIAWNPDGRPGHWERNDAGLPASIVSCMDGIPGRTLWAGTDGSGVFRLDPDSNRWEVSDPDPDRRFVKSISVLGDSVAAGCAGSGVALLRKQGWQAGNEGLQAKSITSAAGVESVTGAVTGKQLFVKNSAWKPVSGFNHVRDICASRSDIWVAGYPDGVFRMHPPENAWEDVGFPMREAVLIRAKSGDNTLMGLAVPPGGPIHAFLSDLTTGTWTRLGEPLQGPLEIYDADFLKRKTVSRAVMSTAAGLYFFDSDRNRWEKSEAPPFLNRRPVALSLTEPDKAYAGNGTTLLVSSNGGRLFSGYNAPAFPSDITAIAVTGSLTDTLWIGTEGGGVYVSFMPGFWISLVPDETGIGINRIAPHAQWPSEAVIATDGVSCAQVGLPGLFLTYRRSAPTHPHVRIYLEMRNPCSPLKVDFHLVRIPVDEPPVFYRFEQGSLVPVSQPAPYSFILPGDTVMPEILLGEIASGPAGSNPVLAAGLFEQGTWRPVAPLVRGEKGGMEADII